LNLGRLYQQNTGQDPRALNKSLNTYLKLLAFQPGQAEANYQSAVLYLGLGSYERALQRISHLSAADQGRAQALAIRCAASAGKRDRTDANDAVARLLKSSDFVEADILSILPTLAAHGRDDLAEEMLQGLVGRKGAS